MTAAGALWGTSWDLEVRSISPRKALLKRRL